MAALAAMVALASAGSASVVVTPVWRYQTAFGLGKATVFQGYWLNGVSCPTLTSCEAVGDIGGGAGYTNRGNVPLAEGWNATTGWHTQSVPAPIFAAGSPLNNLISAGSTLYGVSCISATRCVAVGYYLPNTVNPSGVLESPWAVVWNGSSWASLFPPAPSGSQYAELDSVSCVSATNCVAVGYHSNSNSTGSFPLVERYNGSRWSIQFAPRPVGPTFAQLAAVSCTRGARTAYSCEAVGGADGQPISEAWNGTSWSLQDITAPANARLSSVSCSSSTACTAVGTYYDDGGTAQLLAERWLGSSWTLQLTPLTDAGYSSVSCLTDTACVAVGPAPNEGDYYAPGGVAAVWDGDSWHAQTPVQPENTAGYSGVSCVPGSVVACTAVGSAETYPQEGENIFYAFAERYSVPPPTS